MWERGRGRGRKKSKQGEKLAEEEKSQGTASKGKEEGGKKRRKANKEGDKEQREKDKGNDTADLGLSCVLEWFVSECNGERISPETIKWACNVFQGISVYHSDQGQR